MLTVPLIMPGMDKSRTKNLRLEKQEGRTITNLDNTITIGTYIWHWIFLDIKHTIIKSYVFGYKKHAAPPTIPHNQIVSDTSAVTSMF